jgi:hAT family C-terminal dimerisation region
VIIGVIALRILLTLPVAVAEGERSFSKLKLIKTYLRSSITEDRLDALATISIEHEIAKNLDLEETIINFANQQARRVPFQ